MSASLARSRVALGALLAALIVSCVAWWFASRSGESTQRGRGVAAIEPSSSGADVLVRLEASRTSSPDAIDPEATTSDGATRPTEASVRDSAASEARSTPTCDCLVHFVDSEGDAIEPRNARVAFTSRAGLVATATSDGDSSAGIEGIPCGVYAVAISADGWRGRVGALDLKETPQRSGPWHGYGNVHRVVLWSDVQVTLSVGARDGLPWSELLESLDLDAATFGYSFDVGVGRARNRCWAPRFPDERFRREDRERSSLATVHHVSERNAKSDDVIATLELREEPPFWVGLTWNGVQLEPLELGRGVKELRFEFDAAVLERALARVRLAIVDERGSPRRGIHVRLARESCHGCPTPFVTAESDAGGVVELSKLIAHTYWIDVSDGACAHSEILELHPCEHFSRTVVLPSSRAPIEVHVVDERGGPADAWIEVGAAGKAADARPAYPRLVIDRSEASRFRLPVPTRPSYVRAVSEGLDLHAMANRSRAVFIDPSKAPERLDLVLERPTPVRIASPLFTSVRLRDAESRIELELIDFPGREPPFWGTFGVLPGRYTAELLGVDGSVRETRAFVAGDALVELSFH